MLTKVAVVDKTGRGHSICVSLISNNTNIVVYYIPGSGGIFDRRIHVVPWIVIDDGYQIADFCASNGVELVVVSHIDALKNGIADTLRQKGLSVLGPSAEVVRLESSKWFCKDVCRKAGVSTPQSKLFNDKASFVTFLRERNVKPLMVKADWLTKNGNGAFIANGGDSVATIIDEVDMIMSQNLGLPFRFLVEDYLPGTDFSAHYLLNEHSVLELPSALDFKKSHDGDQGVNCDGMGTITPHPLQSDQLNARIRIEILDPILTVLNREIGHYNGPIYLGLRIDDNGRPHLIEINARLGDSEAEAIFPLFSEDLVPIFKKLADEEHIDRAVAYRPDIGVVISLVSGTVHDACDCAGDDNLLDWPNALSGSGQRVVFSPKDLFSTASLFWANIEGFEPNTLETRCGRIAHIAGFGISLETARRAAYGSLPVVTFAGRRFRTDIGATQQPKDDFID